MAHHSDIPGSQKSSLVAGRLTNLDGLSGFSQRLRQRRTELNLTQDALSRATGIGRSTIQTYETGQIPKGDHLAALCAALGITADWLLLGKGEPKQSEAPDPITAPHEICLSEVEYVMVPQMEGRVAAGPGGDILYDQPEDWYPFKRWWIQRLVGKSPQRQKALVLVRVQGDSMMDTINPGELILVDAWEAERLEVRNGRIYLVRMPDGAISVKRVVLVRAQGVPRILCLSDNPVYQPFEFDVEEGRDIKWYVLGRIRWVGREVE